MTTEITYQDFEQVEIWVGRVMQAEPFAKAPAYQLTIDVGEFGVKRSRA